MDFRNQPALIAEVIEVRVQSLIHSDQGSQFSSGDWQSFLKANNLLGSMSRRGNCHDNAVAESFFQLLKRERIRRKIYSPRQDASADVLDCIEMFYNPKRRHGFNNQLSPVARAWRASRKPGAIQSSSTSCSNELCVPMGENALVKMITIRDLNGGIWRGQPRNSYACHCRWPGARFALFCKQFDAQR